MSQGLPIFREDLSFHEKQQRMMEDMRKRMGMDQDFSSRPLRHRSAFGDDFDQMCGDFFKLRPRDPLSQVRRSDDMSGSRESLDDGSLKSLFVEDPETKSRIFQISFDVKEYEPNEIVVKVHEDTLIVEAKHEKMQDGNKLATEFSRKIQIPKEVESEKLTSALSSDGILTISAPVPPKYHSVTDGGQPHTPTSTVYLSSKTQPVLQSHNAPSLSQPHGRNSPSFTQPHGRNSPSYTQPHGRNSPLTSQPLSRNSPGLNSPTVSPIPATTTATPVYRKQIYMVPQSVIQNGSPINVQSPKSPPPRAKTPPLDTPTFYNTERGCELVLLIDIGAPYTPEDLLVKVDGKNLLIEAEHVEQTDGKKSKSSFSREFELSEHVDPDSVAALLKDGRLKISGLAK